MSAKRGEVTAWAMYDFACSAFTTIIVTFVFSKYYADVVVGDEIAGPIYWTRAINASALIVALVTPVLGAVADLAGRKKLFLAIVSVQSILFTVLLFWAGPGDAVRAAVIFIIANVGFEAAQVFYNSLLLDITDRTTIGRVSGFGWGLGYIGGLLALVIALAMVRQWIPISEADNLNVRAIVLLVAAWYAAFMLPLFLVVREGPAQAPNMTAAGYARLGFRRVAETFGHLRTYREAAKLLVARLVYNDGLTTIFAMAAIYAGAAFGMPLEEFLILGIAINLAAGIGAYAFGFVDDRIGGKRTIVISLIVLTAAVAAAATTESVTVFWIAGIVLGIMVGPNQSASRSLLSRMVPEQKQGEFFGFYAFSGKLSSILGPLAYGLVLGATESHRAAVGSVAAFFVVGLVLLLFVDEREGTARALQLEHAESAPADAG
ncbi:MAG TPA: MFS transporter [Longimicrobiales bacterium]|nr:MFS transporter [Longimicrobiales bacterium]